MKLDEGLDYGKAALDITPLIDVVFLLVLFFAVTTSFISPEDLEALKRSLTSLNDDKTALSSTVESQNRRIDELKGEGDYLRSQLQLSLNDLEQIRRQADEQRLQLASQAAENIRLSKQLSAGQDELSQQQANNDALSKKLQQKNQQLETERKSYRDQRSAMQARLDEAQRGGTELSRRYDLLQIHADALTQEKRAMFGLVASLETERDGLRSQLDEQTDKLTALQRQADTSIARSALLEKSLKEEKIRLVAVNNERDSLSRQLEQERKTAERLTAETASFKDQLQRQLTENAEYKRFYDANQEKLAATDQAEQNLKRNLNAMLLDDTLNIDRQQNQLIINLSDKILFDSGRADIKPQGLQVLARVGAVLQEKMRDLDVLIGGHTDNIPVSGRFGNNWELSAARAVTVVKFLEKKVGIDPSRLSAVGYGEHRPIVPNDSAKGRALNRRIEILLLPK